MSAPALPPITVARFKEASRLIERLADEKRDVFLDRMQDLRDAHMERSRRELTAEEAATIAAAMLSEDDPVELAARVQSSGLRAVDPPGSTEILLAAGAATAPEFIDAATRFVALMELAPDVFEQARETDTLDDELDEAVRELDSLPMVEARDRARAAFAAFSREAGMGDDPGEAMRLLGRTIRQALNEAATMMRNGSSSSLTGSPPRTDGADETSSTAPDGERPNG